MKSLIIIPPITTYPMLGKKITDFPATVIRERITVLSPFYDKIIVLAGSFSSQDKPFVDENIHMELVEHSFKPLFVLKYLKRFKKILRENPDANVLNMNPLWIGGILNLICDKKKHKFITLFISFPRQWSIPKSISNFFYKINLNHSTRILAVTPILSDFLKKICDVKIDVISNRVKPDLKTLSPPLEDSIFFAGRLDKEKRPELLLDIFAEVLKEYPSGKLFMAGPGSQKELFRKIESLGLDGRVELLGLLDQDQVYDYMSRCTIFANPSIHEGFGLVYLEAMSCGIPILATDSGSTRWVVGDAAVLIDPQDNQEFKKKIVELMKSPVKRNDYTAKGFERIKKFNYDSWGQDLFQLIESD